MIKELPESVRQMLGEMAEMLRNWPEERDVLLVGEIGDEITPTSVREALAAPGPVRLVVQSSGGDSAAALAIYHMIRDRPGVTVHVVRAASAAVLLTVAADFRTIAADGRMLVHRGVCLAAGTSTDLYRAAERMAKLDGDILSVLIERTGCADLEKRLDAAAGEWWITPSSAMECGFVHDIEVGEPDGWTPPTLDTKRNALKRAERTLRSRMVSLTDDTARLKAAEGRHAAAEVNADYRAERDQHNTDFDQAVAEVGLEVLTPRIDEALRRLTGRTRATLADVRRQLRVLDLGGKPTAASATPWTCADCGAPNFTQTGDWRQLPVCFHCNKEETK